MIDNINENLFKELARQLNIPVKHGWKTALKKRLLQKKPSIISTWIRRGAPKKFEDILLAAKIDINIWRKITENINISDTGPTIADISAPYPQNVKISDPLIQKTVDILESPTVFKTALKSNIEAFHFGITIYKDLQSAQAQLHKHDETLNMQAQTIKDLITKMEEKDEQIKTIQDKLLVINGG
jgi:hypothetical protein